ncbi:MAG: PD-(D/E)XK nuclease family protein, partial [Prevotella sp.]|nr:PD-(D/E)XK nuclease family protein [Prevotella sp.]
SEGRFDLQLRGIIDRLDQVGDSQIRVVDYKTGARALTRKMDTIDEVFAQPMMREKHPDYYLQTFVYAEMVRNDAELNPRHLPVSPALLFIQHAKGDDYDPTLAIGGTTINDIGSISNDFMSRLQAVLTQMFAPHEPFLPTDDRQMCAYCPYRMMCRIEKSIE